MTHVAERRLVPLAHAAFAAKLDYQVLRKFLLSGAVNGELRGRWLFVDLASLSAYLGKTITLPPDQPTT